MTDTKVFILGSPRSGTSITYFAMREVCRLPGRGESHVMPLFTRLTHQFYNYANDFKRNDGILAGDLDTDLFKVSLQSYIKYFYVKTYGVDGFVDKTPGAEAIAGCEFIRETFPDAKILLLQRNGIEVVNSYRRKFKASFEDACTSWAEVVRTSLRSVQVCPNICVVDQFDLTNAAASTAVRITDYLGMPERAVDLALFFSQKRVEHGSVHDWKKRLTLEDVDWTIDEKQIFLQTCTDGMKALGYM